MNIRNSLVTLISGLNEVNAQMVALAEKRGGTYTGMVSIAAEAGDRDVFELGVESVFSDIRNNVEALGAKTGCKQGKADKDGNSKYVIPSGIMAAKSYMLQAFDHGIELMEDGEPRKYTHIRKEVDAAREAAALAGLSDYDRDVLETQQRVSSKLEGIAGLCAKLETISAVTLLEGYVEALFDQAVELIADEDAATGELETAAQADAEADAVAAMLEDDDVPSDAEMDAIVLESLEISSAESRDDFSKNALAVMDDAGMTTGYVIYIVGNKARYTVADARAALIEFEAEKALSA